MGGVVGLQDFHISPWHFDNGTSSKIDDVLAEDGGLLHVLTLASHLNFILFKATLIPLPQKTLLRLGCVQTMSKLCAKLHFCILLFYYSRLNK